MRAESAESTLKFAARLLVHADALYDFACYLCRDPAQAEDFVQETFSRALAAETSFSADTNLKAWLFRILRNAFLDTRRRERKSPLSASDVDEEEQSRAIEPCLRDDLARLSGLVARDIAAALGRLSEESRAVVLLDSQGFTETEIAEVMSSPIGTVKSRLARARARLREELEEYQR